MAKQNITLTRELTADDKLAPQARVIVDTIMESAGVGNAMDRDDLVAKLIEGGRLNTRQEPMRIVAYYVPRLKESGLIEAETIKSEASEADGEAKPKRQRKAKADAGPVEVGADAGPVESTAVETESEVAV